MAEMILVHPGIWIDKSLLEELQRGYLLRIELSRNRTCVEMIPDGVKI